MKNDDSQLIGVHVQKLEFFRDIVKIMQDGLLLYIMKKSLFQELSASGQD